MKHKKVTWYYGLIGLFLLGVIVLYSITGKSAHIAVADNLDLFTAQFRMLKNTNTWFSNSVAAPFLGGVSRDVLPSELSLTSVIYMIFPDFAAYVICYVLKVIIGLVSFTLLAREVLYRGDISGVASGPSSLGGHGGISGVASGPSSLGGRGGVDASGCSSISGRQVPEQERAVIALMGVCYGALNVFPMFGINFSTIPLGIFFMLRLYRAKERKEVFGWTAALFCFPFVSYFSYFGIFLLAYFAVAWIIVLVTELCRGQRFGGSTRILFGIIAMSIGCFVFERRLFGSMLFSDEVTIRSTMKIASFSVSEAFSAAVSVWKDGMMHCDTAQKYLVLPVCVAYFIFLNVRYLVRKNTRGMFHDLYNLLALIIVFNTAMYGLYYIEAFRNIVETIIPPLEGWQFNRTIFFSPLLWYASFAIVMIRILRAAAGKQWERFVRPLVYALCIAAFGIVLYHANTYNDLRTTARGLAVSVLRHENVNELSYGEFYSEELFSKIKEEIGYEAGDFQSYRIDREGLQGSDELLDGTGADWSVAYGFHPAVLEYNGIATLDGYLGFYAQSYKDAFRAAIAPALDAQEATRIYYDDWGARAYIYAGDTGTVVEAVRNYPHASGEIYVDTEALASLHCKYIFSRVELTNASEKNLALVGRFEDESSPYVVFVYEIEPTR